jgi:hypothetical protein
VQMVSALFQNGPEHLTHMRREFELWGDQHGYATIGKMRGRASLSHDPDPTAVERRHYIRFLQSWAS